MIDVFICTYNPNYEYLRRTVDSILLQDLNNNDWSLTIIDNNSTQPVAYIDFIKQLKVNVVIEKKQGLTAARACAERISKGELLVFVDDDNILAKNYLSQVQQIFNDDNIGIVSGNIVPEYQKKPEKWFFKFENMLAIRKLEVHDRFIKSTSIQYNENFPIGAGMAIRKSILSAYYNDHITSDNYIDGRKGDELMSSEDLDLDYFALSQNYTIGLFGGMKLTHIIPAGRLTKEYLAKLAVGNIKSTYLVNAKWSPIFKTTLFGYFEMSRLSIFLRVQAFKLLKFRESYFIRYSIFKELYLTKLQYPIKQK